MKTKVDAFLKEVARRDGLLPVQPGLLIYNEFELGDDGRALFLKEGHKRVTWEKDSTKYKVLKSIGSADFIRTHLFPDYTSTQSTPRIPPRRNRTAKTAAALTALKDRVSAELARTEDTDPSRLVDLPQRVADVDTAVKRLTSDVDTNTDGLPMREILALDSALQRTRGALVDNLAKLSQLNTDITQAEQELQGEEAANDPEKKRRIQDLLRRLRDERATRLEVASANREAHRSQFSRMRETVERMKTQHWQSAFVHYSVNWGLPSRQYSPH